MSITFNLHHFSLILLILALHAFSFSHPMASYASGELTIEPSVQYVDLEESDAVSVQSISITNNSTDTIVLEIFALNIQQTNEQGAVAFVDRPLTVDSFTLADFIDIPQPIITLEAGQKQEVPFSVQNSADLTPGGHYAAIIARYKQEQTTGKQLILPAVSTFVITSKKGGERYHVSLLSIDELKIAFRFSIPKEITLTFSNEGNIHHAPRGSIVIKDIFRRQTHKGIINDGSVLVLPKNRRAIDVQVKQQLPVFPIMLYTAEITGTTSPGDVPFSQSESMLVINPFFFPFILLFLGLPVLLRFLQKKYTYTRHGK